MRLAVIRLPGVVFPDLEFESPREEAAAKRAIEQAAAEIKRAEAEQIAERTRPRRVFRVVRTGTSTKRTAMYLLQVEGDSERCHWATADCCCAALRKLLATGQRDGFTVKHTVRLPVEPLKQLRKRQRCRDARSTDYVVRAANAARVRKAGKNRSADEKLRLRQAHNASQQK
jgi:hypothetical protein